MNERSVMMRLVPRARGPLIPSQKRQTSSRAGERAGDEQRLQLRVPEVDDRLGAVAVERAAAHRAEAVPGGGARERERAAAGVVALGLVVQVLLDDHPGVVGVGGAPGVE